MSRENLMPRPRLVASGGPVTRATASRRKTIEEERAELRALANAIRDRLDADLELFRRIEAAYEGTIPGAFA